jgi:hypothetical protein
MEMKVLKKYISGRNNPSFPEKGTTLYPILLFGKASVKFQDMWLEKSESNPQIIDALMRQLEGSSSGQS